MDYIVDASVVIEYLITGTHTAQVRHFFDGLSAADLLTAPEFCLLECTNVIWKQVRFSGMPKTTANNLLSVVRALNLRRAPMKHLLSKALDIAITHQLAVYDSAYIALALHYGYPLVTLDQPQQRAAKAEGLVLIQL